MHQKIPPPGYIPVPSAVDGIEIYAPAPPSAQPHEKVVRFACPQCGAAQAYHVEAGGLKCAHCGHYQLPGAQVTGKRADEFEFKIETLEKLVSIEESGEDGRKKELICQACGAQTSIPQGSLTHTCPFCDSNKVIQHEEPGDVLRPRFLIPFVQTPQSLARLVKEWLGNSWMVPSALWHSANITDFTPAYLPYWTFDARTQTAWRAEVGYERTVSYYDSSAKQWKTRTEIDWRWESGRASHFYDDLLVEGTARVSRLLLSKIRNFDTNGLVEYAPSFLAGLSALRYDVPLDDAWETGRGEMREHTRTLCRGQINSSHIRNFSMTLDFSEESWRYVLMPVYVHTYRFNEAAYQVLVNAQTGTIAGQRPVDWTKVWLAIIALLLPGIVFGLIGLFTLMLGGIGFIFGVIGFVLLLVGGGLGYYIYREADAMDDI